MAVIDSHSTLAEVVTAHPVLARELERRGLDYCCGGTRTIAEACTANGLDPTIVVAELSATGIDEKPAAWAAMGPTELVDHLEATHHRHLWDELPRLAGLLDKITAVHGRRHPEVDDVRRVFEELRADLEPHMLREERVLFPMIRELLVAETMPTFHCGSLANPISVMLAEHDRVGELLARLRDLTDGYQTPPEGCASYQACYQGLAELEADTHLHVHKENNLLFPAVVRLEAALRAA